MKKRSAFLLTLLALLLVFGIPTGLLVRDYRREQASRDLITAIKADNTPAALAALKAGADPNARDHSDEKPLTFSEQIKQCFDKVLHHNVKPAFGDHPSALFLLLRGEPLYVVEDLGRVGAGYAPRPENLVLIKALLDAGTDPNLPGSSAGDYGITPLMWAAVEKRPETFLLLLEHGSNVHQKDEEGHTTLHFAAVGGDKLMVHLLLDAGVAIEVKDNIGRTPFHFACMGNNIETAQTLHELHASINVLDKYGFSPLDLATDPNFIKWLRQAGAKTRYELSSQSIPPPKG